MNRYLTWARFGKSFELCFWWDDLPRLVIGVDWTEKTTFFVERY